LLIGYDVHLGDSVLWRARANTKQTLRVYKDGLNTLWGSTEAKSEIPVNIKPGREYYVRCQMVPGILIGRPKIELIDEEGGKMEFDAIRN
jgi:hypothetical protein